jgi:DNA topoisomerase IB
LSCVIDRIAAWRRRHCAHANPHPERQAARAAGLRYVDDTQPGISRRRAGKGFSYRDADGHAVRDAATLQRIRALAIPPAYTAVWICAHANGHLQATGRDARGRKQYRYHADWAAERDAGKFDRIIAFGEALPTLRRRLARSQAQRLPAKRCWRWWSRCWPTPWCGSAMKPMPREPFVRTDHTAQPASGLLRGGRVRMRFRGKSGQLQEVTVGDRRLGLLVRGLQQLPGQALFQYRDDDGALQPVDSGAVNDYLREVMGEDFTAKDFRTWGGTVAAVQAFAATELPEPASQRALAQAQRAVVCEVASLLGNTPAVCRKAYIDPCVFAGWERGELANWPACVGRASGNRPPCACCAGRAGSRSVSRSRSR